MIESFGEGRYEIIFYRVTEVSSIFGDGYYYSFYVHQYRCQRRYFESVDKEDLIAAREELIALIEKFHFGDDYEPRKIVHSISWYRSMIPKGYRWPKDKKGYEYEKWKRGPKEHVKLPN